MKEISNIDIPSPPDDTQANTIRCYLDQTATGCVQKGLMAFIDHLDDLVIVFEPTGLILYVNTAASRYLGYAPADLMNMNIESLLPGVLEGGIRGKFSDIDHADNIVDIREIVTGDGKLMPVESKFSMVKWQNKTAVFSLSRDIRKRIDVEKALRESERRLSTLMSNLPGMAYRCKNNTDWTMEFVSQGCHELTGYKPEDFIGNRVLSWKDLMDPEDRQWVYDAVQEALSRKDFFRFVWRLTTRNGQQKWVWEQGVGVYGRNGEVLALEGFITDVTEHQRASEQLHSENLLLRSSIKESYNFCGIVGRSKSMQKVFDRIIRSAESHANVIIYGESGTGKELTARAIHDLSERRGRHFVPVNCGAIPENLIESEFFGYKKGAFSSADADKPGFLDQADGGTLFLDEIGEIKPNLQVKLLRAIEGGGYTPVGGQRVKTPDIRIIAATNRHLKDLVHRKRIRKDFFYRIHVIPITIPPLRQRKEDLPLLIPHFLKKIDNEHDIGMIPQEVMNSLYNYDWPGNVRELQNVLQRYITLKKIDLTHTQGSRFKNSGIDLRTVSMENTSSRTLQSALFYLEKQLILKSLERHHWHRGKCARALGIAYRTLLRKIKQHDIDCHNL